MATHKDRAEGQREARGAPTAMSIAGSNAGFIAESAESADATSAPRTPSVPAGNSPPAQTGGAPRQTVLFGAEEPQHPPDDVGYRGPIACSAAGITYRQLDYWARTGLVAPSVRDAQGSGSQRLYSFRDVLVLKVVKRLLDTGVSLHNIRVAVELLRARGVEDLAHITLLSDGASVYECTSQDEIIDLLAGGQAVFGIAVGRVVREMEGELASLPSERATDSVEMSRDDLAARRRRRTSA